MKFSRQSFLLLALGAMAKAQTDDGTLDATFDPSELPTLEPTMEVSMTFPPSIPPSMVPTIAAGPSVPTTPKPTSSEAETTDACLESDWSLETCEYPVEGLCDAGGDCAAGTDCYDCDPCKMYNFDCGACVENGCYWCPGDALCSGRALEVDFYDMYNKVSACNAQEDWLQTCDANPDNFFSDPLYDARAWAHEMINVEQVWKMGYTGSGVHVRVNDDGVDGNHPEFSARFEKNLSCPLYLPGIDEGEAETHGTACASIIAAEANNDVCAVGVAPDVTLSACKVIGPGVESSDSENFLTHWEVVDVSSNSWGPDSCAPLDGRRQLQEEECMFNQDHPESPCGACSADMMADECKEAIMEYCPKYYEIDPVACAEYLDLYTDCSYKSMLAAESNNTLAKIAMEGRNGLGTIIVFASGNNYGFGENTNFDGWVSSRFTIGVSAVGKDRLHGSYSNPGASVLVSAPGGDSEFVSNNLVANPAVFNETTDERVSAEGQCRNEGEGTSFAAPVVSGVVALMLEANPGLGWRDVQAILATTAQMTDEEDESWTTNGVGLNHSDKYGFGIVDAYAAVNASLTWENLPSEQQVRADSGALDVPIVNDETETLMHAVSIEEEGMVVESVVVYVNMVHGTRGDLRIELVSPSGTVSELAPSDRPEDTAQGGEEHWKLLTVKNYYEDAMGPWTLKITDADAQQKDSCKDLPFSTVQMDVTDTCSSLVQLIDKEYACALTDDATGAAATTQCCYCDGGETLTEDKLVDWSLVVYGHKTGATTAISKTP